MRSALVVLVFFGLALTPSASAFYNVAMFWKRLGFALTWPFTAGTDAQYSFGSSVELVGGVARLKKTDQIDDDNTATGYAGGTLSGVTWDVASSNLRLAQTGTPTNTAEFDSSWTPHWANIVGVWHLNEAAGATTFSDSSGHGNNGTKSNIITSGVSAKLSQGIDATGGGTVQLPLLVPSGDMTVSAWVYWTQTSSNQHLFFDGSPGSNGFAIDVQDGGCSPGNKLGVYMANVDCDAVNSTYVLPTNAWTHVALTRSGNLWSLYANGNLVASNTATPVTSTGSTWIGAWGFPGLEDEFAIWNTALSATDIQTIYSRQSANYSGTFTSRVMDALATGQSWTTLSWKPTLPFLKELPVSNELLINYPALVGSGGSSGDSALGTNLVGLWHLDESAGTSGSGTVKDASGVANATPSGNVTFGSTGQFQGAATFDGTNGYIETVGTSFSPGMADFSVGGWIKTTSTVSQGGIITDRAGACDWSSFWVLGINETGNTNKVNFSVSEDTVGTKAAKVLGNATVNDGKWHQIFGTRIGTTLSLYVDGALDAVLTGQPIANISNSAKIQFAKNGPCPVYVAMSADELGVWSRGLNAAEILQLYRRGANRLKHQVRVCTASDCSDDATGANWKGPDGTNQTYFSELYNVSSQSASPSGTVLATAPSMLFSNFTSPVGTARYFQYRTILESDDAGTGCNYGSGATWCSPELMSVTVDPVHYDNSSPSIIGVNGVIYSALGSFVETLGASCSSGIGYNLGVGASSGTAVWYWWDSSANAGAGGWVSANGTAAKSNSAATISAHAAAFGSAIGTGTVYFKAYLKSSGTSGCELDQLDLTGSR